MKTGTLTDRQTAFCQHYAASGNASEAARLAGYSPRTAAQIASRLLRNVHVKKAVQQLQMKMAADRIADATEVAQTWTTLLRDTDTPSGSRLRAGELLMRAGGGFLQDTEDQGDDLDPPAGGTIRLPYVRQLDLEPFNAVETENGEIVPLSGYEDEQIWRFICPYRMDELAQQMATDEAIYQWDEPD